MKDTNIYKCQTFNPFEKSKYLAGYKDTNLTKIISIWKLNGSIFSTFVWRSLRELGKIDSILTPEGEKIKILNLLENVKKDIYSKNFDLIFVHTLVPHRPYGFDKDCNYDGSLSLRNHTYSKSKHFKHHNIERNCVVFFLRKFLGELKKNNFLNEINLTIMSDHGSRIDKSENSSLSSIFAFRNKDTFYKEISEPSIIHDIFSNKFSITN